MQQNPHPNSESESQLTEPITSAPAINVPLKVFLQWSSPVRPFKRREREFYTTAGSIVLLVCIILLFLKEFLLIMAIVAFSFLIYSLSTVEPEVMEHKITNKGIDTFSKTYFWDQLGRFWFEQKWDDAILCVENFSGLPPRLMILLGKTDKKSVTDILEKYLLHERPEKSQIEKWSDWLQQKVPLETSSKPPVK